MKFLYFGNYDESITPEIALGVLKEVRDIFTVQDFRSSVIRSRPGYLFLAYLKKS